jgi:hypothetical protein
MNRLWIICGILLSRSLLAMTLDGTYDPTTHDVFSSGYPASPVRNISPTFVGAGRDLSSVAWSASGATKSFGMVSPEHYLVARHFGGAFTLKVFGADDSLYSRNQLKTENTNLGVVFQDQTTGDLALGTLIRAFPLAAFPNRIGLLDLHDRSDANSPLRYNNLSLHIYGRGPDATFSTRLGETPLLQASSSGNEHTVLYTRNDVQLEGGDSGSPTFHPWTNPNGDPEYALIGNHAAIDEVNGFNFDNFAATREVIQALNGFMTDEGRSLRIVGNPSLTWVGERSTDITRGRSWGLIFGSTSTDVFVRFRGDQAGNNRLVNVDSPFNLRGLYFTATGSSSLGFDVQGSSILEIGRGGITNYDQSTQLFQTSLRLTHDQFWNVGPGGITIGNLDLQTHHVEWSGTGTLTVNGLLQGTGSVAIDQGIWIQNTTAAYTGDTWIHEARFELYGDISSSPRVYLRESGLLSGYGVLTDLQGSGTLSPGPGPSMLTARSLSPETGLTLQFELTQPQVSFSDASATLNDLVRLTGPAPFSAGMDASCTLQFFLNTPASPAVGDRWEGGFFTDTAADFLPSLQTASIEIYLPDPAGDVFFENQRYQRYSGTDAWVLTTRERTAAFSTGEVTGQILELQRLPQAGTYDRWTFEAFPSDIPLADRDPDDVVNTMLIPNRIAYSFDLNPVTPDLSQLPQARVSEGFLELIYRQRTGDSEATYLFDSSVDLQADWIPEALTPEVVDPDPDGTGQVEEVKVRKALDGQSLLFLRVRTPLVFE